jgi:hypothetical protein
MLIKFISVVSGKCKASSHFVRLSDDSAGSAAVATSTPATSKCPEKPAATIGTVS